MKNKVIYGSKTAFLITGIILFSLAVVSIKYFVQKNEKVIWLPEPGDSFQWQFVGKLDESIDADIYSLDLFDTDEKIINDLHKKGKKVICYVNVGAWEDWRPDANNFPKEIIGKNYSGWPGERWFDIRRIDLLSPLIKKRFELCKQKGFDAIEPDNLDGYEVGAEETGFDITYEDQLVFNRWLSKTTHSLELSIGLKNNPNQAKELLKDFDWAILESCYQYGWCDAFKQFIKANKVVAMIEYSDTDIDFNNACSYASKNGFSMLFKNRSLDAWVKYCK